MTSEEMAQFLIGRGKKEGISNVRVDSEASILSQLANRIVPKRPYCLKVSQLKEAACIRMLVFPLLEIRHTDIFRKLIYLNFPLLGGCVCADVANGVLYFKILHLYENREAGLTPVSFGRLLDACTSNIRIVEQVLLFERLIEAGLSEEQSQQVVEQELGELINTWVYWMKTGKAANKLTEGLLMALPKGNYIVSNCYKRVGHNKFEPIFQEEVTALEKRRDQWDRIKAARVNGRLFRIYTSKQDYEKSKSRELL